MPRFFVAAPLQSGAMLALPDEVVRHIQVLRLAPGATLTLFNGEGGAYAAELIELERRSAHVAIGAFDAQEAEPPYRITLAQGIAGGDKMDWLIEKAVELGATAFAPITATRSVVRLTGERAQRRQSHWQGIVRAACEQCGRNRLPAVAAAIDLRAWLDALALEPAADELRLLLSPRAAQAFHSLPATAPTANTLLLIGPEGGLTDEEEAAAQARGFTAIGLGPRVLRTETAGMAVLAALAARWGGW